MEFIKKHKFKLIGLFILVILMLFAFLGIKELIYPNNRISLYGNRLEGIEDVKISDKKLKESKEELLKNKNVEKVSTDIKGRIINYIIEVKPDTDLVTSKSLATKLLEFFSDKEKEYYDFQVFLVTNEEDNELYPMIGYKHKTSVGFVWMNS
ncbi:MAG: hypothetical protein GX247_01065 [Mollicutes bacterium]|nr:hypothetical protein [Mollicutes bacterium]